MKIKRIFDILKESLICNLMSFEYVYVFLWFMNFNTNFYLVSKPSITAVSVGEKILPQFDHSNHFYDIYCHTFFEWLIAS